MTPQEISSCSLKQIDAFGTELGKVLTPDRLAVLLSAAALGFVSRSRGSARWQHHLAPEASIFVNRINDCVGVLDAIAHGDIADGHKRQMER